MVFSGFCNCLCAGAKAAALLPMVLLLLCVSHIRRIWLKADCPRPGALGSQAVTNNLLGAQRHQLLQLCPSRIMLIGSFVDPPEYADKLCPSIGATYIHNSHCISTGAQVARPQTPLEARRSGRNARTSFPAMINRR
jgi:hypothetical protein